MSHAVPTRRSSERFGQNFRDASLAKAGADPKELRRRFPRLIVASCKGFLSGPYQNRTALDEVVQMMTGLAYMTGPTGTPLRVGSSDRKSVVYGKSVSVRVDLGGRRIIKKKNKMNTTDDDNKNM